MSYFKYFPQRDYQFGDTTKRVTDISKYAAIFADIADDITFYTFYPVKPGERLDTISQQFYGTPDYYWTIPLINSGVIKVWSNLPRDYRNLDSYVRRKYPGTALLIRDDQEIAGKFSVGETVVASNSAEASITEIKPSLGYLVVTENDSFPQNEEFTVTGSTNSNTVVMNNSVPHYLAPAYYREPNSNQRVLYDQTSVPVTIQEEEFQLNEVLSPIKIIRPEFISTVARRFEDEMNLRSRAI